MRIYNILINIVISLPFLFFSFLLLFLVRYESIIGIAPPAIMAMIKYTITFCMIYLNYYFYFFYKNVNNCKKRLGAKIIIKSQILFFLIFLCLLIAYNTSFKICHVFVGPGKITTICLTRFPIY